MNYGYVKVAAAVPRVKVADCKFNASEIEKEIIIADGKGVQIIAFPSCALPDIPVATSLPNNFCSKRQKWD